MFALHPYLIPSKLRPDFAHPNTTTIGLADYPKLVALLTTAFARTAQAGATLPIIYDEFGYQTRAPMLKRSLYTHLGTPAAQDAITEPRQALYYQQAIAIARCQPTVAGMLIFHVTDERDANAWQSGVYYPDDTPKTSMDALRSGALAAQDGTGAQCAKPKTASNFESVVFHQPPAEPGPLQIDLTCASACTYTARLIDLHDGTAVASVDGAGTGLQTIAMPGDNIRPASTSTRCARSSPAGRARRSSARAVRSRSPRRSRRRRWPRTRRPRIRLRIPHPRRLRRPRRCCPCCRSCRPCRRSRRSCPSQCGTCSVPAWQPPAAPLSPRRSSPQALPRLRASGRRLR